MKTTLKQANKKNARITFYHVYQDTSGRFKKKQISTIHSIKKGKNDDLTLISFRFEIGDFIDVNIGTVGVEGAPGHVGGRAGRSGGHILARRENGGRDRRRRFGGPGRPRSSGRGDRWENRGPISERIERRVDRVRRQKEKSRSRERRRNRGRSSEKEDRS